VPGYLYMSDLMYDLPTRARSIQHYVFSSSMTLLHGPLRVHSAPDR
jgi:hypothetical protein